MLCAGFVRFGIGVEVTECEAVGCYDMSLLLKSRLCLLESDSDCKAFYGSIDLSEHLC
jgi:hypothetical protein